MHFYPPNRGQDENRPAVLTTTAGAPSNHYSSSANAQHGPHSTETAGGGGGKLMLHAVAVGVGEGGFAGFRRQLELAFSQPVSIRSSRVGELIALPSADATYSSQHRCKTPLGRGFPTNIDVIRPRPGCYYSHASHFAQSNDFAAARSETGLPLPLSTKNKKEENMITLCQKNVKKMDRCDFPSLIS